MELWDVYDCCFHKTGELHERGTIMKTGQYHLVVNIFPVNEKGKILIQKRSNTVEWKPGYWAATGGSAVAGEDAYAASIRELQEEIGILANHEVMKMVALYQRQCSYQAVFLMKSNVSIRDLKLQKEEVADAKWASITEIKEMIQSKTFHQYHYLDWLFNLIPDFIKE